MQFGNQDLLEVTDLLLEHENHLTLSILCLSLCSDVNTSVGVARPGCETTITIYGNRLVLTIAVLLRLPSGLGLLGLIVQ